MNRRPSRCTGFGRIGYSGGGSVAVLGVGAIGIMAVQWAKYLGADKITAYDTVDSRLELAKEFGADVTVNCLTESTLPDGFVYMLETAGQPDTIRMCFELIGNKGKICFVGTPHRDFEEAFGYFKRRGL